MNLKPIGMMELKLEVIEDMIDDKKTITVECKDGRLREMNHSTSFVSKTGIFFLFSMKMDEAD